MPANLAPAERDRLFDDSLPTSGLYVALTSTTPTDATVGTELAGNGYGRQALPLSATVDSGKSNSSPIIFGPATADWGSVSGLEIWTASTGGSRRWRGPLSRTVKSGDRFIIGTGALALQATKPFSASTRLIAIRDAFTGGRNPAMWDAASTGVDTSDKVRLAATQVLVSIPNDPRGSSYSALLDASGTTGGGVYGRIFADYPNNLTNYVSHHLHWDSGQGKFTMTMGEAVNDVDQAGTVTVDVPGGIVLVRLDHTVTPETWTFRYMLPGGQWILGTTVTAINPMTGNARLYFRATSAVPGGQFTWVDDVGLSRDNFGPTIFTAESDFSGAGGGDILAASVTASGLGDVTGSGSVLIAGVSVILDAASGVTGAGSLLIPSITPTITGDATMTGAGTLVLQSVSSTLTAQSDFTGSGTIGSGTPVGASTISDNFNDNVIASEWVTTRAVEASGKLVGTADGVGSASILRNQLISIDTLATGVIYWQMPDIVGTACWGIGTSTWTADRQEFVGLYPVGGGSWHFAQIAGGLFTGTEIPVTLTPGMWARLVMVSGVVYLDTSVDGVTWDFQGSITPVTGTANYLSGGYLGGITVGTTSGDKVSFDNLNTPPPATPIVTTEAASNITATTATINGTVNPNGSSTTYSLQWGTTTAYPNTAAGTPTSPLTGTSAIAVSANITGLISGVTYHYRVTATNAAGGPITSVDGTFTAGATITTPSVLLAEVVTTTARVHLNNGDNSWGGNQNRIVRINNGTAADGVYCIYQISDGTPLSSTPDGGGGRTWQVKKRTGTNTWTIVATGPTGGVENGCPGISVDQATGRIWFSNYKNPTNYVDYSSPGKARLWTGIPSGSTFTPADDLTAPNGQYALNSIYQGTCILPNGLYVMVEGLGAGAALDVNEFWRRNAAGTWTHFLQDYSTSGPNGEGTRWGYTFLHPDRQGGNGAWVMGSRDGHWSDYGYTIPTYDPQDGTGRHRVDPAPVDFVYNDVRAWHTNDLTVANPVWTEHAIHYVPQANTGTNSATCPMTLSTSAGSYVDKEGRFHVISQYTSNRVLVGSASAPVPAVAEKMKHSVLSPTGTLLSQVDIPGPATGYYRFCENLAGSLFILGANTSQPCTLYAVPNRASATTGTTWNLDLGATPGYSGIHEAGIRNGNKISDTPDFGFIVDGSYNIYRYAQIQLPTG